MKFYKYDIILDIYRNLMSCVVCLLIQDSLPCLLGNQYSYEEPSQRIPAIVA